MVLADVVVLLERSSVGGGRESDLSRSLVFLFAGDAGDDAASQTEHAPRLPCPLP